MGRIIIRTLNEPINAIKMDFEKMEITALIPQRAPFLMVDRILSCDDTDAVTELLVRQDNILLDDSKLSSAGIVENMAYFECPDCGKQHKLFGESHIEELAEEFGIDTVAHLPIDPKLAAACDKGTIELYAGTWLDELSAKIEKMLND